MKNSIWKHKKAFRNIYYKSTEEEFELTKEIA